MAKCCGLRTQGDPLAMPLYALATTPLIDQLSNIQDVIQVWYADDASTSGSLASIRKNRNCIKFLGPAYGYHANVCKTWLIAKEQYLSKAIKLFNYTGHKVSLPLYPPGSEEFIKEFVTESSGMVGTTPWAGQHYHHPTSCHIRHFWAWICAQP